MQETSGGEQGNQPVNGHGGTSIRRHPVWLRALLVAIVLFAGIASMQFLAMMREEPEEVQPTAPVMTATGIVAEIQDVPVILQGYGTARSYRTTEIIPQVSGKVVYVHQNLRNGGVIPEGDVLLRIEPNDYQLALDQAQAELARLSEEIRLLEQREENDERRLELAQRTFELQQRDYNRIEALVQSGGVESQARLEEAARQLIAEEDEVVALRNALALYPAQRAQLQAQIAAARSRLERAELDLERTEIAAPFTGRVEMRTIELYQQVAAGEQVLILADDSVLEIPVSLQGEAVTRWLAVVEAQPGDHWITPRPNQTAEVVWTERPEDIAHTGELARIQGYNTDSRTFDVIVQVGANHENEPDQSFPLVDGMFCEVAIPGKTAENVVPIPRAALYTLDTVLVSNNGKIETRPIEVARVQGDVVLVSNGIRNGEIVLTSRPANVIDGANVEVMLE